MNISSTAPKRSCFRALSVVLYCLKRAVASLNWTRTLAICGPVELLGMMGVGPGLPGGWKGTAERVAYTAGETVR